MKLTTLLLFSLVTVSAQLTYSQPADRELPVKFVAGYGPFSPNMRGPFWQNESTNGPWARTYPTLRGIPTNWQDVKQGHIQLDDSQFVYQHAKAGTIPVYLYESSRKGLEWPSDTTTLSAKAIRCFVSIITGKDVAGKPVAMLDTDGDLDFSDEQLVELLPLYDFRRHGQMPEPSSIRQVLYQRYENGRAVPATTDIAIGLSRGRVLYTFPTYAVAVLSTGRGADTLATVSDNFVSPSYRSSTLVNLTDSLTVAHSGPGGKLSQDLMSNEGEYIRAGGKTYQYLGVDLAKQVIRLKNVAVDDSLYSTQLHYKAPPFVATELRGQQPISLASYRGKYVLLDFWGTWCAPCRAQMPFLKEAYAKTDRNTLEIIGIAANDTPGKVKDYTAKEGITWPQIMADDINKLVETYQIQSYPTTLLIDPKGRVLIKGLGGKNMVDILTTLNRIKH